jgi:hypothetical protein
MKKILTTVFAIFVASFIPQVNAADLKTIDKSSTGFDVILLAGQSNMAGRGAIPTPLDEDGQPDPAIKMWDPSKGIVEAKDPIIHPELGSKPTAAGPGMSFAKAYLAQLRKEGFTQRRVLLVGAAWGGTSFIVNDPTFPYRWMATKDEDKGGDLYRAAVMRSNDAIKAAQSVAPDSAFKAILWHQGESDITYNGAPTYAANHTTLMRAFRNDIIGGQNAPIVVGEMTPCFLTLCTPNVGKGSMKDRKIVHDYLHNIGAVLARAGWVSSEGLAGNLPDDQIHFDLRSQRELGKRYFQKLKEINDAK